jgi:hypothetical protein
MAILMARLAFFGFEVRPIAGNNFKAIPYKLFRENSLFLTRHIQQRLKVK